VLLFSFRNHISRNFVITFDIFNYYCWYFFLYNQVNTQPIVSFKRISGTPLISKQINSDYDYNTNPGFFTLRSEGNRFITYLAVTVKKINPANPGLYNVLPSKIGFTSSNNGYAFAKLTSNDTLNTLIKPNSTWNNGGASNPRIIKFDNVIY
jgi:hypothetical protein